MSPAPSYPLSPPSEGEFPGEFVTVNLADTQGTARVLADLTEKFPITGLVNNVELVKPQAPGEAELSDLEKYLNMNEPQI